MEDIWNEVLDELAVPKDIADKWWDKIVAQYSDSVRIYHNMECLAQKFKIYDEMIKENITERSAFIIAIFFQHFEYDTNVYGGCIDKNVDHVKEFFKEAGIDHEGLISSVVGLLGAGRESIGCSTEGASAYFQDLELAPLGLPSDEYIQYIADVEMEYAQQPVHLYRSLRLKVLQTLLLIPKIFATDIFRERFEEIARDNIQSEIDQMLL